VSRSARPRRPRCDCSWCLSKRQRLVAGIDALAEAAEALDQAEWWAEELDDDYGCYSYCAGCEECVEAEHVTADWRPTLAAVLAA
jgi:hypothetical protein